MIPISKPQIRHAQRVSAAQGERQRFEKRVKELIAQGFPRITALFKANEERKNEARF